MRAILFERKMINQGTANNAFQKKLTVNDYRFFNQARAWFPEIVFRKVFVCLYVCMHICLSFRTHVSKPFESSLYTNNKG